MLIRTILAALLVTTPAFSADVWAIRVKADGPRIDACRVSTFTSSILFQNTSASATTVHLVNISNGARAVPTTSDVTIPPFRSLTAREERGVFWTPASEPEAWAIHLNVPDSVRIQNRLEERVTETCFPPGITSPPSIAPELGKAALPVFRDLFPAGAVQTLFGLDDGLVDSDIWILVYNAGLTSANISVELYQACDDTILDRRTFTAAPDTVSSTHFAGLYQCATFNQAPRADGWSLYARVKVDEPSVSLAITSSRKGAPFSASPFIGVAVTPATVNATSRRRPAETGEFEIH